MKLANIIANLPSGAKFGQAATGTSDSNCWDVRVADASNVLRDIKTVIVTDTSGTPITISRRLVGTPHPSYKYVYGPLVCAQGNNFNNYSTSSTVKWRVYLEFRLDRLPPSGKTYLAYDRISSSYGWDVAVNSSGQIVHTSSYNGNTTTTTWPEFTLSKGAWYTMDIYGYVNQGSTVYLSMNGSTFYSRDVDCKSFNSTGRNLTIGDSRTCFRNSVIVQGVDWRSTATQRTLSVNIENAAAGYGLGLRSGNYKLTGPTVQQYSYTDYEWVK